MVALGCRIAVVWAALAAVSCRPSIQTEPRATPRLARATGEECYADQRLELVVGNAAWKETTGYDGSAYEVTKFGLRGLAFYRGSRRVEAEEAVGLLDDPQLRSEYRARLAENEGAAQTEETATVVALAGSGAGLVLAGIGLVPVFDDNDGEANWPFVWAGAGALGVASVAAIVAYANAREHSLYYVDRALFVDRKRRVELLLAAREYNKTVAAKCGYKGPVKVRITRAARGLIVGDRSPSHRDAKP